MHENYVYDLWPPWLDLTPHLHEKPARTAIAWFVLFFSTRSVAAVREASAAAELIMISPRPPLRSTPHVERRRLIRISGNCRRPTAEGGERIVNHAAVKGFFCCPFQFMVATASNREEIFRARASSQVDLIFSAAASSLGRKFQNHEQISFIFELFVPSRRRALVLSMLGRQCHT